MSVARLSPIELSFDAHIEILEGCEQSSATSLLGRPKWISRSVAPLPPVLGAWAPGPQNKIFCVFEVLAWVRPHT